MALRTLYISERVSVVLCVLFFCLLALEMGRISETDDLYLKFRDVYSDIVLCYTV